MGCIHQFTGNTKACIEVNFNLSLDNDYQFTQKFTMQQAKYQYSSKINLNAVCNKEQMCRQVFKTFFFLNYLHDSILQYFINTMTASLQDVKTILGDEER